MVRGQQLLCGLLSGLAHHRQTFQGKEGGLGLKVAQQHLERCPGHLPGHLRTMQMQAPAAQGSRCLGCRASHSGRCAAPAGAARLQPPRPRQGHAPHRAPAATVASAGGADGTVVCLGEALFGAPCAAAC